MEGVAPSVSWVKTRCVVWLHYTDMKWSLGSVPPRRHLLFQSSALLAELPRGNILLTVEKVPGQSLALGNPLCHCFIPTGKRFQSNSFCRLSCHLLGWHRQQLGSVASKCNTRIEGSLVSTSYNAWRFWSSVPRSISPNILATFITVVLSVASFALSLVIILLAGRAPGGQQVEMMVQILRRRT